MVFQTLNRLKWGHRLPEATVVILHRGAPEDRKTVLGSSITEVKKGYFLYVQDGEEIHIPNHRVLEIRLQGEAIWRKHGKALGS